MFEENFQQKLIRVYDTPPGAENTLACSFKKANCSIHVAVLKIANKSELNDTGELQKTLKN